MQHSDLSISLFPVDRHEDTRYHPIQVWKVSFDLLTKVTGSLAVWVPLSLFPIPEVVHSSTDLHLVVPLAVCANDVLRISTLLWFGWASLHPGEEVLRGY